MNSRIIRRLSLVFAAVIAVVASSCHNDSYQKEQGLIWNTAYHISYEGDPSLADSIRAVLNDVDRSLNVFDSTSLVSRVNRLDTVIVDPHFIRVYKTSVDISKESDGMFDPTLSPLITAWGFGPGHTPTADTLRIPEIMESVGIGKTELRGDTLIKQNAATNFNFSAIAKGYACDAVAQMLRRNEVTNYLVEIGGEIAVGGVSPSKEIWKISVDRPVLADSSLVHDSEAILSVTDAGIATSGNYRNFRREGSKTIGHTISPKTGRPEATDVISATVIAPTAMEADAAATACMAAGSVTAKQLVAKKGYECLLVLSDSTTWSTPGLDRLLRK